MKSKILSIILAIAMLASGMMATTQSANAAVTIVNGNFETGDLTGWTFSTSQPSGTASAAVTSEYDENNAAAYKITPDGSHNSYFALLFPSLPGVYSILSQPFSAAAGDWVSGEACFGSEDYLPYDDNAQVLIVDTSGNIVATVFSASSSTIGGIRSTGWVNWGYKFTASGTYAIRAQVTNIGDDKRSSVLALDNVSNNPESSPYTLNLPVNGNGTLTANGQSVSGGALTGLADSAQVNLTATPAPGWSFNGWSGSILSNSPSVTVTMSSNKTVMATFIPIMETLTMNTNGNGTVTATASVGSQIQTVTSGASLPWGTSITLNATPYPGWSFGGWSGGISSSSSQTIVTLNSNLSVTATFTQNTYTLTVTPSGNGTVNLSNPGPYHYGDTVQLTAVPGNNSSFSGWGGDLDGTANPASITIHGNMTISASFITNLVNQYTISVGTTGSGSVSITSNGQTISSGSSVAAGATVTLTATPANGWSFSNWSGNATGNVNPLNLTLSGNTTITATFTQNTYTLTVNTNGNGTGSVSLNNSGPYHYGDVVQLTAVPAAGSYFSGWGGALSGPTNPASVTIHDNTVVSASFTANPVNQYTLSVNIVGTGTVTLNPNSSTYSSGTSVTLTAVPAAGWSFVNWSWTDPATQNSVTVTTISTSVTIVSNLAITATFTQNISNEYTVSVVANGSGTASISPAGGIYTAGSQITLNASPAAGWSFGNWSGSASGTANPLTITVNSNLNITANFTQNTYTLVTNTNGGGTVKGNNTNYHYGDQATLTPVPADGWQFSSWSGGTTGNNNPLVVTINSNMTITANFTQILSSPYALTVNQSGNGSVNISPDSPAYASGALVTLNAIPDTGWDFSHWTGDITGNTNPVIITMNSDKTVKAHFNALSLSSSMNPSTQGKGITITATAASDPTLLDNNNKVIAPTGTIQFSIDGNNYGTPVTLNNGAASIPVNDLTAGDHSIAGQYSGDVNYTGATIPGLIQVVNNTSIAVISTPNPSTYGQSVGFTATVTGSFTAGDTVSFMDGSGELGTGTLNSSGTATYSTTGLAAGSHTIMATYSGLSSNVITQPVNKANTATVLTVSSTGSGDSYKFSATVSAVAPGAGIPAGTVTFSDGITELGNAPLASGQATLTHDLASGTHTITAAYNGDDNFITSNSNPITQTVKANSNMTVTSAPNASVFGQTVTFTATVTGAAGTPTGSVTFSDGSNTLGSASLTGGQAVYSTSALSPGSHTITAQYEGDTSYNGSSANVTQTVNKAGTTTAVTSSSNPSKEGQSLTFTATVTGTTSSGVPSGTVTFKDGSGVLGTGALNSSGQAIYQTKNLEEGTHVITAIYAGDVNFNGSTSPSLNQIISDGCTRDFYSLRVLKSFGGTVTVQPRQRKYQPEEQVTLTATANQGYVFVRWEGSLKSTDNPATLTMNSDKIVKAVFVQSNPNPPPQGTLVVTKMMINWKNWDNGSDKLNQNNQKQISPDCSGNGNEGSNNKDDAHNLFQAWGRFQLPAGVTLDDLKAEATVTLMIHGSSISDSQVFEKVQSTGNGTFWLHNSNEKNPPDGMDVTYIKLWWAPDKSDWKGWAGFHVKGIFQLPDKGIGKDTKPTEATLTITIPLKSSGNISDFRTISFKVNANENLWNFNRLAPGNFPCSLDNEN